MHFEVLAKLYSNYYDSCFTDADTNGNIVMITPPITYNKWYDSNEQQIKKMLRKYKLEKLKAV